MKGFVLCLFFFGAMVVQAKIIPLSRRYSWTFWQAYAQCYAIGGSLALPSELEEARKNGYSHCSCGWVADKTARYPMAEANAACGGRAGVHQCTWRNTWDAYCYIGDPVGNCSRPLGMENGAIPDLHLTSTTTYHAFWNERWGADRARLNRQGVINAWMPHHDGRNQHIEIDLGQPTAVTGILTQGVRRYLKNQYVTAFKIAYSKEGQLWRYYKEGRFTKVFKGNSDNNGIVRNMFQKAIVAQHIRVYPYRWVRHISLRLELLGCDMTTYDNAIEQQREEEIDVTLPKF